MEKFLLSCGTMIITVAVLFPLYEEKGTWGYGITLAISIILGILVYFLAQSFLDRKKDQKSFVSTELNKLLEKVELEGKKTRDLEVIHHENVISEYQRLSNENMSELKNVVMAFQQFGVDVKENMKELVNETNEQILSGWKSSKEDLVKLMDHQQKGYQDAFANIAETQGEIKNHLVQQEKLFSNVQKYYEKTGDKLDQYFKETTTISTKIDVSIKTMQEQLQGFSKDMTLLFDTKIIEQHDHLHQSNETIQQSLIAMQQIEKENIERYEHTLHSAQQTFKELFQLFYETEKHYLQNQEKWLKGFKEQMNEKINDIKDASEEMMEKEMDLFERFTEDIEDFTKQLVGSQQQFVEKQEAVYETMVQQSAASLENTKLTKKLQTEIIDLNKQDIDLLQELIR